jgi:hypothetical protein
MERSMDTKPSDEEKRTERWFKKVAHFLTKMKERIILSCKTVLTRVSKKSLDDEICQDQTALETDAMQPWKIKILEDFQAWLSEVPDQIPPTLSVTPDTCDLYTLFSEFTALKQEIKMQNREQHRTLKALNQIAAMTDAYSEVMDHFKEKTKQIAA